MKAVLAAAALLCSLATGAAAQPWFTMTTVIDYENCTADAPPYQSTTVYFIVDLNYFVDAITAVEFRIAGFPDVPGDVVITQHWETPLVIGTPGHGIALAFSPALAGPRCYLGRVEFFVAAADALGDDYCMEYSESLGSGRLLVVDSEFNEIDALGDAFVFNPVNWLNCNFCPDIVSAETQSWSAVKSLY
ncbi:MAG: hypothetical protein H6693_13350 [Candidatus Latescibacteria bacterium]|nr:hypothetical protein [Candidatus Latescibacterota bacterium]